MLNISFNLKLFVTIFNINLKRLIMLKKEKKKNRKPRKWELMKLINKRSPIMEYQKSFEDKFEGI